MEASYDCDTAGADPRFFLGGGALVSCSTSTPINHIVFFFLQNTSNLVPRVSRWNTSCIRKPQVISGWGGGGAHPLHPPPRSAPALTQDKAKCFQNTVEPLLGNSIMKAQNATHN